MKITIISQWMVPYATPRSFRTFELAKELAKNHDVTVYALLGQYDYSGMEKETGIKIRSIGKSRCGNIDSIGYHRRTLLWGGFARLFGKLLQLPQIELMPMVKKIALAEKDDTDLFITIAHPYSIHWGVLKAKRQCKQFPVWISDCGDPFMGNPYVTPPSYYKKIEMDWGAATDFITVPIQSAKNAYYEEVRSKIIIIPQGFAIDAIDLPKYNENTELRFIYAGMVYPGSRDPSKFLEYLQSVKQNFKFVVYTRYLSFFEKYKKMLGDKLEVHDFIPREELLKELRKADFLVDIANTGSVQSPSKLIDYALADRPILEVTTEFKEQIIVDEFLCRDYHNALPKIDISEYDIKNVAQKFVDLYYQKKGDVNETQSIIK